MRHLSPSLIALVLLIGSKTVAAADLSPAEVEKVTATLATVETGRTTPAVAKTPALPPSGADKLKAKEACAQAAQGELSADNANKILAHKRACMLVSGAGTTGGSIEAEIVRSVAQVVATKAQAAGWARLTEELEAAAQCNDPRTLFPATCKVLASLRIQDLVSSPTVLLNAVVLDVFADLNTSVVATYGKDAPALLNVVIASIVNVGAGNSLRGLAPALQQAILNALVANDQTDCSGANTSVEKYTYVASMCLVQTSWNNLLSCTNATDFINTCGATPEQHARVVNLWNLTVKASQMKSPVDLVALLFAIEQATLDDSNVSATDPRRAYVADARDLVEGLAAKDWVEATSGAVRLVEDIEKQREGKQCPPPANGETPDKHDACVKALQATRDNVKEFLELMAAVGNYALTFDSQGNKDPAASAAAREKIIADLADRMVHRTDRKSGAAISLGGALGLIGGARLTDSNAQVAFPLQLTLGLGLQTYGKTDGGFHLMVSAIDVGQYVSLNDTGNLTVATPDLKSSVIMGVTVGYWFTMKETPFYLGLHGSVAPFNRAGGSQTFEAGGVAGIYIPLLDIN